jgi:hypothetical protein
MLIRVLMLLSFRLLVEDKYGQLCLKAAMLLTLNEAILRCCAVLYCCWSICPTW